MKPLFIPLKAEFFDAFERGDKTHEYRAYGPRWNEKTCVPGRLVTLSRGYGKQKRLQGRVKSFRRHDTAPPEIREAWARCYGNRALPVADIEIELTPATESATTPLAE